MRGAIAGFALLFSVCHVQAHSWYPMECCNDQDCRPIDKLVNNGDGTFEVWVGHQMLRVPRDFPIQQSLDSDAHVCLAPDFHTGEMELLCMFVPGFS
jgi:hypothetical protein